MPVTEELKVVVRAEAKAAIAELQKLQKTTKGNTTAFAGMAKTLIGFGGVTAALLATKKLVIDNISAGIKYAAAVEKQTVAFEVMLGSLDQANIMMAQLTEFSSTTPFQLENITSATQKLLAFGTASEDIVDTLRMLGNAAMGDSAILDRLTLAFGKVQAKGKATLEELNMFTEAGVPLMAELAKQTESTKEELFDMITKGKIGFEEVNDALKAMTTGEGQFAGMIEKQSETLTGVISTLRDNIKLLQADMVAGFVDPLKEGVKLITQATIEIRELINESRRLRGLNPIAAEAIAGGFVTDRPATTGQAPSFADSLLGLGLDKRSEAEIELFRELQGVAGGMRGGAGNQMSFFGAPGARHSASLIRDRLISLLGLGSINEVRAAFPKFQDLFSEIWNTPVVDFGTMRSQFVAGGGASGSSSFLGGAGLSRGPLQSNSPLAQLIGDQMLDPMVQDIMGGGGFEAGLGGFTSQVDTLAESIDNLGESMQQTFLSAAGQSVIDAAFGFGEALALGGNAAASMSDAVGAFWQSVIQMLPQMLLAGAAQAAAIPGGAGLPLAAGLLAAAAGTAVFAGAISTAPPDRATRSTTIQVFGDLHDVDTFARKVNAVVGQRNAGI